MIKFRSKCQSAKTNFKFNEYLYNVTERIGMIIFSFERKLFE